MASNKEINFVLQSKLTKITHVLPQDKLEDFQPKDCRDIFYSVKPFYNILILFGLQKISFKNKDVVSTSIFPKIYSYLIALAVLCVQVYVVILRFQNKFSSTEPANAVTVLLSMIPPTIAAIASLIMSATCYQRMIARTLKNFQIIDTQLNIQSNEIYKSMRVKVIIFMTCIISASIGMYWYDLNINIRKGLPFNELLSVMWIVLIIKELSMLELALLIGITSTRLDILNTQLENTKYDVSKLFTTEVAVISKRSDIFMSRVSDKLGLSKVHTDKPKVDEKIDDLTRIMRIFDRLADNANIVNSCFGIQLLSAAIAVFINILYTVSELIALSKKDETDEDMKTGNLVVWCIRDLVFVTAVTMVCELLQSKVKNTSNIINKLSISSKIDPERQELLERFSQLMACRKFTISACNFFPFDFTFIYSLVGAVATYTVIILQVSQTAPKPKT